MEKKDPFLKEANTFRDLKTLEEIEKNPSLTQRDLAENIGVALGIANSCIHTLVRKGLVKIRGDNNRRITYHLTKSGILHKGKLAMEWTRNTIEFYREGRQQIAEMMASIKKENINRVILYGANELSEIAALVAPKTGIEIEGIAEDEETYMDDNLFGIPVSNLKSFIGKLPEAVIICKEIDEKEKEVIIENLGKNIKIYELISR